MTLAATQGPGAEVRPQPPLPSRPAGGCAARRSVPTQAVREQRAGAEKRRSVPGWGARAPHSPVHDVECAAGARTHRIFPGQPGAHTDVRAMWAVSADAADMCSGCSASLCESVCCAVPSWRAVLCCAGVLCRRGGSVVLCCAGVSCCGGTCSTRCGLIRIAAGFENEGRLALRLLCGYAHRRPDAVLTSDAWLCGFCAGVECRGRHWQPVCALVVL